MSQSEHPLASESLGFVEALYVRFLEDPESVGEEWREWFTELAREDGDVRAARRAVEGPSILPRSIFDPASPKPGIEAWTPPPSDVSVPTPSGSDLPEVPTDEMKARRRFLRRVKLFAQVPDEEIALVARAITERSLDDGEYLFREGEPGNSLYLLSEGHLVVRRGDRLVATINRGEVVGELSVLDSKPRSADLQAHGPAHVYRLDGRDLLALLQRRPQLSQSVILMLTARLRRRGSRQDKVNQLIHAYRVRGHLQARLDPLDSPRPSTPELELENYGLRERDLDSLFSSTMIAGTDVLTLRQILELLQKVYCHDVGVQFMHIDDLKQKRWLQGRMEDLRTHRHLSRDEQLRILTKLTDAEILEQFIHKKFLGAKRFSLEGAETLVPLLELLLDDAGAQGTEEVVIGMAHRGRLNVLVNVMGKSARQVFREFADEDADEFRGRGDVKYHLGYSNDRRTVHGHDLHLSLCFNPSHLEFVGPVVLGRVRAKQDRRGDAERRRVLGIVIHGDAAIAGQGVAQELFNLSDLDGYETGGTVHIVVNNQIGFTTPPEAGRSTKYCTDVARMLQTPVFHVNGESPEAVAQVVRLAMDYRAEFQTDVIVDMYCYRRYGHNEGDEPAFTQPQMYDRIRKRKSVREGYLDHLLALGGVSREEADEIEQKRGRDLETELDESRQIKLSGPSSGAGVWQPYRGGDDADVEEVETGVPLVRLAELLRRASEVPEGFGLHRKLQRFFDQRRQMADGERPLDWGTAETLALSSLLVGGAAVRLTGQDSRRGTFSHRHAFLHDGETGEIFAPMAHLEDGQGSFQIWDSPLSEIGVLGFEYGYSLDSPEGLCAWEAQFGDFCNVAQVIIDQFITSSEDKWSRLSGLVMLLPHGFEGQGPEHSSARLERFLTLAAEDNIQVVNLTTPAQYFHCLRRQVLRPLRKPLVVMSPKSLLRHPRAVSTLGELSEGGFERVIADVSVEPASVRKVLLTSGKLYWELVEAREERERQDVAIVRVEQLYPLREEHLEAALGRYGDDVTVAWVQEEPANMGASVYFHDNFGPRLLGRWPLQRICRPASASPATGSKAAHVQEQAELIEQAFA